MDKRVIIILTIMLVVIGLAHRASAQEQPPRPLQVTTFQNMSFGAFINGNSGGTVSITPEGARTSTGDIYLVNMGMPYYPAIFEIEALPGNIIHVMLPSYATLTGPGGKITQLEINSSLPVSPFINTTNPPFKTQVRIGGTLNIGNPLSNPSGDYYGTFTVTFMQE
ncbi:MAG: DUF4402 domain-containing protein [Chloroflexota bacterium]|nr:DUF4402 domain-containing protein [Lentimicrobium sp.]